MYKKKKKQEIQAAAMAALQTDIDKREGSFASDMAGPLSVELGKMYDALDKIRPMVWVDETSGIYLDMAAEDLGMEPRKQGTKAIVLLEITGTPGFAIPPGTVCTTGEGLEFALKSGATIGESGVVLAEAAAKAVGRSYNVEADTIAHCLTNDSRMNRVTNPDPAMGGTDPETDASLYARLVITRQRPATSGNAYHYEQWALAVSGVGAVKVFPLKYGNGTVEVLIADKDRQPVDGAVVQACFDHIEQERPTTARVTVVSAEPRPIDIGVDVKLAPGYSTEAVEGMIRQEIAAYFLQISLQYDQVRLNRLGAILMDIDGVVDYDDLLLGGLAETVQLTPTQIPVLGEVALTWI